MKRKGNHVIIKSLNVGRPQLIGNPFGQVINSSIRKKPVSAAYLYKHGFEDDHVADKENHGGEERAVCLYPFEHYQEWNQLSGKTLPIPAFGENITIGKHLESAVCVGDIYQVGSATVQITQSRVPCAKVDIANRMKGFLNQFIQTGKTGYFAKVLEEGAVETNANVTLVDRPQNTITVSDLHHLFFHDRHNINEIERVIMIEGLAEYMRSRFDQLLNKHKR